MSSSSGTKRKVEELGEHVVSAALGDVVARTMSAAVGRYEAYASLDEQLERLGMLLVMVHSAVDEAERVHIASWWLRRWHWRLRDAALEGDEVLLLFRRRRAAEEATAETGNTLLRAARRAIRSAKNLFFARDDAAQLLRRTLATLEKETMGLGEFLKMLDLEIKTMPDVGVVRPCSIGGLLLARFEHGRSDDLYVTGGKKRLRLVIQRIRRALDSLMKQLAAAQPASCAPPIPDADTLRVLVARIRRALDSLRKQLAAAQPASCAPPIPDADTLRVLVARIRHVVHVASGGPEVEFPSNRRRLAEWRGELQAVADRAERVLLAAPVDDAAGGSADADARDGGMMRRTARSVETMAAHLDDFVALVGIALFVSRRRSGPGVMQCKWSSDHEFTTTCATGGQRRTPV